MPPQITPNIELRFQLSNKQTLLVRELTPKTSSDFVAATSGGLRKDQGLLSSNSNAGIAESSFYTGLSRIKGMAPGANIHIQNSMDHPVVIVQLEDS